jgi:hypothetical protein
MIATKAYQYEDDRYNDYAGYEGGGARGEDMGYDVLISKSGHFGHE